MIQEFETIEREKAALIEGLEHWSDKQLAFRSTPDAWSALQIIDHLEKTEAAISEALREGVMKPHAIALRDRLGTRMVQWVFRSDRRVKVPGSANVVLPGDPPELAPLCERWNETRLRMAAMLSELSPAQCSAGVFRHPVAGWMNVGSVLAFFSVHMLHHGYQFKRLQKAYLSSTAAPHPAKPEGREFHE